MIAIAVMWEGARLWMGRNIGVVTRLKRDFLVAKKAPTTELRTDP